MILLGTSWRKMSSGSTSFPISSWNLQIHLLWHLFVCISYYKGLCLWQASTHAWSANSTPSPPVLEIWCVFFLPCSETSSLDTSCGQLGVRSSLKYWSSVLRKHTFTSPHSPFQRPLLCSLHGCSLFNSKPAPVWPFLSPFHGYCKGLIPSLICH